MCRPGPGVSLLGGRDLDRDGVPDLLVASGEAAPENPLSSGTIFLYSGRDGGLLATIRSPGRPSWGGFGFWSALGPPQPGSLFPVFSTNDTYKIVGGKVFSALGRVTMFRSLPQGVASFGTACSGTLARAPRIGIRDLGSAGVRLQLSHAPPAARSSPRSRSRRSRAAAAPAWPGATPPSTCPCRCSPGAPPPCTASGWSSAVDPPPPARSPTRSPGGTEGERDRRRAVRSRTHRWT